MLGDLCLGIFRCSGFEGVWGFFGFRDCRVLGELVVFAIFGCLGNWGFRDFRVFGDLGVSGI